MARVDGGVQEEGKGRIAGDSDELNGLVKFWGDSNRIETAFIVTSTFIGKDRMKGPCQSTPLEEKEEATERRGKWGPESLSKGRAAS